MQAVILAVLMPIMLLNFLGGIVGGIWLIILGDWSTFFGGLAYGVLGAFLLSILMLPGLAFAYPMTRLAARGHEKTAMLAGAPSLFWTYIVVTVSCVWVFASIMSQADETISPYLLWSYSTATAPWVFLAQKDAQTGNEYAGHTTFFAQLGLLSLIVAYLIGPNDLSLSRLVWWFGPFMVLGLLTSVGMIWANVQAARRYKAFDDF